MISEEEYALLGKKQNTKRSKSKTVGEFFRHSPLFGFGVVLDTKRPRTKNKHRNIVFE